MIAKLSRPARYTRLFTAFMARGTVFLGMVAEIAASIDGSVEDGSSTQGQRPRVIEGQCMRVCAVTSVTLA